MPASAPRDTNLVRGRIPGCRGGVRTSVLSIVALAALAAVVIIILSRNLSPPENAPSTVVGSTSDVSPRAPVPDGPQIAGTITVAPDLAGRVQDTSVLFIIAHKGPGAPFAVKRVVSPRFPLAYRIGPEDVMMTGSAFEGEVQVSARLSRSGSAGPAQPGDLEGDHPSPVSIGAGGVDITISRVH